MCLSFDKFAMICADYNIFSMAKQNRYLNIINEKDLNKLWDQVAYEWVELHDRIDERIKFCKRYIRLADYNQWKTILKVLNDRMLCKD